MCISQISFLKALGILRVIVGFGFEGTLDMVSSHPTAMDRNTFYYPRLIQTPSNLAVDTFRDRAATASLRNLCHCITMLTEKNFFLTANVNLPSFISGLFPLVLSLHTPVKSSSPASLWALMLEKCHKNLPALSEEKSSNRKKCSGGESTEGRVRRESDSVLETREEFLSLLPVWCSHSTGSSLAEVTLEGLPFGSHEQRMFPDRSLWRNILKADQL